MEVKEMNTKEVIEILEIEIKLLGEEIEICNPNDDIDAQIIPVNKKFIIEYNQIIKLLQQGEKYKQMCNDIYSTVNNNKNFEWVTKDFIEYLDVLKKVLFPKEAKHEG